MAPPVRAPDPVLRRRRAPRPDRPKRCDALDPQGSDATDGASGFAIGDVAAADGAGGIDSDRRRAAPAATAAGDRRACATASSARPRPHRRRPARRPGFALPAAAWAARSGDPVLFAEGDALPKATAAALNAHTEGPGLRPRPRPPRSPPRSSREIEEARPDGRAASPARTRSPTRSPSPATPTAASAGTSTTPATASSSPAPTRRSTPPPRRRSRPPAPGGRCCSPTAPIRLPAELRELLPRREARLHRPTRPAPSTTTSG